jgi:hypothetical protein
MMVIMNSRVDQSIRLCRLMLGVPASPVGQRFIETGYGRAARGYGQSESPMPYRMVDSPRLIDN